MTEIDPTMGPDAYWRKVAEMDERAVGMAFAEILVPHVPGALDILAAMPPVDDKERDWLMKDPSVKAAGDSGAAMARVGLSPLGITDAASAIAHLAHCAGGWDRPVTFGCQAGVAADVPRDAIEVMVLDMSQIEPVRIAALTDLTLLAAGYLPSLIYGFRASRVGDVLSLVHLVEKGHQHGYAWDAP